MSFYICPEKKYDKALKDVNYFIKQIWVDTPMLQLETSAVDDIKYLIEYFNSRENINPSLSQIKRAFKKRKKSFVGVAGDW